MTLSAGVLVTPTLLSVMLALGLSLRPEAMHHWRTQPDLPLRVLLGSCVVVPLLAWLLLQLPWSDAISRPARHAIALMAVCPSAPLALRKANRSGGDRQLAALLQVSAALAAIVSVPLLTLLYRQTFGLEGWLIRPLDVAKQVLQVQMLPLLAALVLRRQLPGLADRIEVPLEKLANGLLLLLIALVLLKAGPQLISTVPADPAGLMAMVLVSISALVVGWTMGAGQHRRARTTALVTAMRNPGLALLFATAHGQDIPALKLWILTYVLVTVLISIGLRPQRGQRVHP